MTGPDNVHVSINIDQIVSMRPPRAQSERTVHKEANCIVFLTDSKFVAVEEDCDKVRGLIVDAKGEE